MKDCIIDEYPTPFCCKYFCIVINPDMEVLNKRFYFLKDDKDDKDDKEKPFLNVEDYNYDSLTLINVRDREHNGNSTIVVVYFNSKDREDLVNTVAHEAFHVVSALMTAANIPMSEDTEECYAYNVGYIAECYWKTLNKLIDE